MLRSPEFIESLDQIGNSRMISQGLRCWSSPPLRGRQDLDVQAPLKLARGRSAEMIKIGWRDNVYKRSRL